ncbi:MAG: hypothetical protein MUC97_13660 [Bernardetiaceae bacterium]|jgi:hypothetical protein|nr:hypothetical protein [Bernardetiaceae bacterium]
MKRLRNRLSSLAVCLMVSILAQYACTSQWGEEAEMIIPTPVSQTALAEFAWTPEQADLRDKLLNDMDFLRMLSLGRAFMRKQVAWVSRLSKDQINKIEFDYQRDTRPFVDKRYKLRLSFASQEEILEYEAQSTLARIQWLKRLSRAEKKSLMEGGMLKVITLFALINQPEQSFARLEQDSTEYPVGPTCYTTPEICDCLDWCTAEIYSCETIFDAYADDWRRMGESEEWIRQQQAEWSVQCHADAIPCANQCVFGR